jgi:hypothetical protein
LLCGHDLFGLLFDDVGNALSCVASWVNCLIGLLLITLLDVGV